MKIKNFFLIAALISAHIILGSGAPGGAPFSTTTSPRASASPNATATVPVVLATYKQKAHDTALSADSATLSTNGVAASAAAHTPAEQKLSKEQENLRDYPMFIHSNYVGQDISGHRSTYIELSASKVMCSKKPNQPCRFLFSCYTGLNKSQTSLALQLAQTYARSNKAGCHVCLNFKEKELLNLKEQDATVEITFPKDWGTA